MEKSIERRVVGSVVKVIQAGSRGISRSDRGSFGGGENPGLLSGH
jgi:hypothetical protein